MWCCCGKKLTSSRCFNKFRIEVVNWWYVVKLQPLLVTHTKSLSVPEQRNHDTRYFNNGNKYCISLNILLPTPFPKVLITPTHSPSLMLSPSRKQHGLQRRPHSPGMWVLYFYAPLIGQVGAPALHVPPPCVPMQEPCQYWRPSKILQPRQKLWCWWADLW